MADSIVAIRGEEILDSRGYPTLRIAIQLRSGLSSFASVPSGASTGEGEAHELRDNDPKRYGGRGVLKAVASVAEIDRLLRGKDPTRQAEIDRLLIDADGTPAKSRLGANAIVGVSMAVTRAGALASRRPLYAYLANTSTYQMPIPMMNVINGGHHAANSLDFQEFMIVPHGASSFRQGLRWAAETYHALRSILSDRKLSTGVGDEGGFAPNLEGNEAPCALIVEAIQRAGYVPGEQIALALDPAASSFWRDGAYRLDKSGAGKISSDGLQSLYEQWVKRYPIVSIEDGFAEHDWPAFKKQSARFGDTVQIVGDDIYVTNRKLIERGIAEKTTNAVLIKLNQIGTVTETIDAITACKAAGWNYIVSHRSGETDDAFIADFTVAMGGGQIKAGAPCRGERIAKYNRLLEIERECGTNATYCTPFFYSDGTTSPADTAKLLLVKSTGHEVIAIIEEAATAQRCLDIARQAAALNDAFSLTALHICADPAKIVGAAEELDLQMLRERREGTAQERMSQVHQTFDQWVATSGAKAKWAQLTGDVTSLLAEGVKNAVLIAISRPHNMDSADALHAAVFDSGRPVLFIPTEDAIPPRFGRHIMIAWKPRPHARNAVQHVLPWLRAADQVSVVIVNETEGGHDADEVRRLLGENGIAPDIRHVRAAPGEHVADRLLKEAAAAGADALVMGAYRFGQVVEWVFGGVTRDILNRSHLPVFMMH